MVNQTGATRQFGTPRFSHLLPGDHACFLYETEPGRREVLRAFVRDGLDAGQRVAYVSGADPDSTEDWLAAGEPRLGRAVAAGQLLLVGAGGSAPGMPPVDPRRTLESLQVMADEAMTDGYPALRLAAEGPYLTEGLKPDRVAPFEHDLTHLVEANRMLALCLYPGPEIPAPGGVLAGHPDATAAGRAYPGTGLRITLTSAPPGLRLAGELDRQHLPAFVRALAELVETAEVIRLDMRSLTFIDVAAVTAIATTATGLDEGRQVLLDSPPSMTGRILAKCWQGIPLPRLAICATRSRAGQLGTTWTGPVGAGIPA